MPKNFTAFLLGVALVCVFHQIASAGKASKTSPSPYIRPKGVIQNWSLETWNVAALKKKCRKGVKFIQKLGQRIVDTDILDVAILKDILECNRLYTSSGAIGSLFTMGSLVAISPEVRKVCEELNQLLSKTFLEFDMRKDVYLKLKEFKTCIGQNSLGDVELDKCLDKLIEDGIRNGLDFPDEKVKEIEKIKNEIMKLENKFEANVANETLEAFFTEEELKGLDPELESLRKNKIKNGKHAGKIRVTPDLPLLTKCINPDIRREVDRVWNSSCMTTNAGIVKQLLSLRAKLANLIEDGSTYAGYVLKPLMAEKPDNVLKLLGELVPHAKNRWVDEKNIMLKLKGEECDKYNLKCDKSKIEMSDYTRFYNKMTSEKYKVDAEELRKYFPLETVLKGIFKNFETVLGLKISRVENAERWHDNVTVYQVEDSLTGEILGYVYLDLYHRDGKFSHATMITMQQGCNNVKGDKLKYVGLVICDFTNETKEMPTLLYHYEVQRLLGRLVHLLGRICGKSKTPLFNGSFGSQSDFQEAPVEMLMNWCYEVETLKLMSSHYEFQTEMPLPTALIENLVASRTRDGGVDMLFQLFYAITDQQLHNLRPEEIDSENFDPLKIYKDNLLELTGLEVTDGADPLASWIHIGGGYGATYYNYLWSEVYGADMFDSTFKNKGILSPEVGEKLRNEIFAPGGTLKGSELFQNFTGREDTSMNINPFLEKIGVSQRA